MASLCEGCRFRPWEFIKRFYEDNEASLKLLRDHGALPSSVRCPNCNQPCTFRKDEARWYCGRWSKVAKTKRRRQCSFTTSDYKGTFLQQVRLPPWQIVSFINHWLSKSWDHHGVFENLGWAEKTSVNWRKFCSEVTEDWLENQEPIGGEGVIVEIDESCFGKRRDLGNIWVFGGIERESKKRFLVPLVPPLQPNHSKETLVPLVRKYIRQGSVICSDGWGAYLGLGEEGYTHRVINHSLDFVDPGDRGIHTQNIKRLWRDVKEWIKLPGTRSEYYRQYLARYLFVQDNYFDRHHQFLVQVARLYPPQSERPDEIVRPPLPAPDDTDFDDIDPDDPQPGPSK